MQGMFERMAMRLGLLAILASAFQIAGCRSEPAEQRLRDTIDAMQAAVVERRPADFMEHVTDDFIGNQGYDRAALHNMLRVQTLRNAEIGATRGPLDIQMQGERATVRFKLVATGGAGGLLPERAQGYAITSGWREEGGEWMLFLAEWEEAL